MSPSDIIDDLCQEYGVSTDFGQRLRPLVKRAVGAEPTAKKRIMDLVRRSFAEEASRTSDPEPIESFLNEGELLLLRTVSAILHDWNPPGWLGSWGDRQTGGPIAD